MFVAFILAQFLAEKLKSVPIPFLMNEMNLPLTIWSWAFDSCRIEDELSGESLFHLQPDVIEQALFMIPKVAVTNGYKIGWVRAYSAFLLELLLAVVEDDSGLEIL